MWINATKGKFTVDRSGKRFIFTNNLYFKKEHPVLLLILNCKSHVNMSTVYKILKGF